MLEINPSSAFDPSATAAANSESVLSVSGAEFIN